jgi:hypothetical protein
LKDKNLFLEEDKMKKLITICAAVTMILVLSGMAQAEIKTYYIVDYPACQIDTATRSTIHVSGTIMADPTTGVIDSASFTISSGTQSYTASNVEVNPYINSNSIYAFSVTPTQIVLNETYGCIYLKGVNGGYTESLQWYIPPDPWTPGFYPYRGYMGFEGAGHGSGLGFGGDIGTVYPWVVATAVPPTTTTVTALPVANSIGSADYAAEFAPESWQANATVAGQKSEYYVSPQALFGRDVNIGELSSISYFTKKNTTHTVNTADWYINIYTVPDTNLPVHGSWYGNRIGSEPYFSQNLLDPCNTWNRWVTPEGQNNRLRFFDSTNNLYFGSYTDGFLSDLIANVAYKNQKILLFSVQTGSAWANGFTGLVDGLSIQLTSGDIGQVNFVATSYCPELLVGDLNGDCRVDMKDLAVMVSHWLESSCTTPAWCEGSDINESSLVNFADFAALADNWLKCNLLPQSSCQ